MRIGVVCAIAVILALISSVSRSLPQNQPTLPLELARILAGKSSDEQVVALYGKGHYAKEEGHLGGRYYLDMARSFTLHIEIGVDRIVESVELFAGVHPELTSSASRKRAVTKRLTRKVLSSVKFGPRADVGAVLRLFGRPSEDKNVNGVRTIVFERDTTNMRDVLSYSLTVQSTRGRVVSATIYNGE